MPPGSPFRVPPVFTIVPLLVRLLLVLRVDPSGMVRVSLLLISRSFCNSTLPYTVPSVPSNTMPLLLLPVGVGVGSVTVILDALIPPFLASTIAFSLTVRLVVALVASYAPT